MEKLHFIRHYFRPVQPGGAANASLHYAEFTPSTALQPFIACYWALKSSGEAPVPYRVVADGSVDMVFDLLQTESYWSVTSTQALDFQLEKPAHYWGVRFLPACVHYFFDLPLEELIGQTLPARDLTGSHLHPLLCELAEAASLSQQIFLTESALLQRLAQRSFALDPRLLQALHQLLHSGGNASIEQQVANWISPRQLRRLFAHHLGLNPKTFARIVRFQQSLAAMQQTPPKQWGKLLYDAGYFDQSHFIREFKIFYGDSPKKLRFPHLSQNDLVSYDIF